MLHVVGVGAAVAPDVTGDPSGRADVVVAADGADVLLPRADADERGAILVGEDLLRLVDVHDDLRPLRGRDAEALDRHGLAGDRLERVASADPPVVAAVEEAHVVDPGVAEDHRRAGGRDLAGTPARPLLVRVTLGVAAVEHDRRVVADAQRPEGLVELGG